MRAAPDSRSSPDVVVGGQLTEEVLSLTRFSAGGFVFDNREGIACVLDAANVGYKGAVVLMRPSVFLSLVPADGIRSAKFLAETSEPFGSPYLEVRISDDRDVPPRVREHEGRARMTAILATAGDVPVPVCLFVNMNGYTLRAHEIEPEMLQTISAGTMRERRDSAPPEWVEGPLFEDAMVMVERTTPTRVPLAATRSATFG